MAGRPTPSLVSPSGVVSGRVARPAAMPTPRAMAAATQAIAVQPASSEWFAGFGGTQARRGGSNIQPGVYVLYLEAMHRRLSQKPETMGHQLFIAEFTVTEVLTPQEAEYAESAAAPGAQASRVLLWGASNRPGERVTYICIIKWRLAT
jgi:hypothetical protein